MIPGCLLVRKHCESSVSAAPLDLQSENITGILFCYIFSSFFSPIMLQIYKGSMKNKTIKTGKCKHRLVNKIWFEMQTKPYLLQVSPSQFDHVVENALSLKKYLFQVDKIFPGPINEIARDCFN